MTVKELSQLYWLNREIEEDQRRLADLELKATSPSSPNWSGVPGGNGGYPTSRIERYVAEIIDLKEIIKLKQQQCIRERNRLERYIAEIPDSFTRQVFTLRFINGLSWDQTAMSVGGGNNYESVKKRVYRYLKSTKD